MDSTQATKLMPVRINYETIVSTLLADSIISSAIGDRITFMPPQEKILPYVFFDIWSETQDNSDDRQAMYFRNATSWRLIAPSNWTRIEMQSFMERIWFLLQKFEGTTIDASVVGNQTTANIYLVETKKPVFFDDINQKGYKTYIIDVAFEWK